MSNPAKARGTSFESAVVEALEARYPMACRLAPGGIRDRGDIGGIPGWIVEAKNYVEPGPRFGTWLTVVERRARERHAAPLLIVKRRARVTLDAYAVLPLWAWLYRSVEEYAAP